MRIGFEQVPPVQIRTDSGFAGLAVEIINEAAKRAGLSLQWVETGTSSDEAFRRGLVDLWPIMADLPERRKRVHITRPWLHTSHTLVLREGSATPDRRFAGRIAVFKLPIHVRLAREEFPDAQLVQFPDPRDVVKEVCTGHSLRGLYGGSRGAGSITGKAGRMRLDGNLATRITHPSRVARPISKPASCSRIAACRYSGVWSQYLDTTVAITTVLKCAEFCIINTLTRGSREHS